MAHTPDTPDAALGAAIRGARCAARMTQAELGAACGYSHSAISRIESGQLRPDRQVIALIADTLSLDPGHLLGLARRAREAEAQPEASSLTVASSKDPDLAAMDAFRAADLASGGGRLYTAVVTHLQRNIAPRLMAPDGDDGAYVAAAGLSEMAGWAAHDRGDDALALKHFARALPLARTARDEQLAAHIAASTSTIALHAGDAAAAVHWASTGLRHADGGPLLPTLTARLHAVHGRALAAVGERRGADTALAQAEQTLGYRAQGNAHPWLSGFDLAALATETTAALMDLRQHDRAVEHAQRAVTLRDGGRVRSRALSLIALARVHATRRNLDASVEAGHEALTGGATLSSVRVLQELDGLRRTLTPHAGHGPVAAFLERLAEESRTRQLLMADIVPGGFA